MRQEMLLRTPDLLSTFRGRGLGTRLVATKRSKGTTEGSRVRTYNDPVGGSI